MKINILEIKVILSKLSYLPNEKTLSIDNKRN